MSFLLIHVLFLLVHNFPGPLSDDAVPVIKQNSTSYVSSIRQLYTFLSNNHTSEQWTHLPRCEFIQLLIIEDIEVKLRRPKEETAKLVQRGKIETLLGRNHYQSIELPNLFPLPIQKPLVVLPPPQPSRICLIEGAPGGGKSILALHICEQWAQGASWLDRFDIVVLVYLREEAVQNAKNLADILPVSTVTADRDTIELQVSSMQRSFGKGVLFIFDGWDEFPHKLMNNSLVSTIIRQPYKLSLHQSTVLITSRPVASGNLLHIADLRVEILGFTQQQIHEYIERSLNGDSIRIQKLVQHLEEHPVIEGYCYVPLHVAILVHVFLRMEEVLPTTLHELFCSLVLCIIIREKAKHEPDAILPELSSLDDLPDDLKSEMRLISKLAYNGVMQNKVVFYSKDLQASELPSKLPSFGLLQAVQGLTLYSKSLSYFFLHLSVQELLAAYNISLMDPSEQIRIFKELFGSSRFQAVLHYYCGFTKLANPEIKVFISSFQTGISSFRELLPLLHCFFEAQQPSLCQLIDSRLIPNEEQTLKSKELSPVDFLAIGYFITSLLSTSATSSINLVIDGIDDHCLKMLLSELSKYCVEKVTTSACVLSLRLKLCLRFTGKNDSALITKLRANKLLTHLDLSNNINLSNSGIHWIIEGLQQNNTLVNLNLSQTGISTIAPDNCQVFH